MEPLNFPTYPFRFKNSENKVLIFDEIRKKFVVLQPEEWVRQHVVQFLIREKGYPKNHVSVERQLMLNGLKKRYDIIVYGPDGGILILVECKSPATQIDQSAFDQIARYNLRAKATYLMVSNGLRHFYCKMDLQAEKYTFLEHIPDFSH